MGNPIIVALDVPSLDRAVELAGELAPVVGAFKVGKELFTAVGPEIVHRLRGLGGEVFLDLKYHDIPNTVAGAVAAAVRLEVRMLTLHASGGKAMMRAAVNAAETEAAQQGSSPPLLLGVTVLTSLDDVALDEIGYATGATPLVERLARLAVEAGLPGLVCSPRELGSLRELLPSGISLVTPGIRPAGSGADDQKRTLTPAEAIRAGARWLVIGRPIVAAANPRAAAERILGELTL